MRPVYSPEALELAGTIQLAVFDVDGVMTDGRLTYASDGSELKSFHSQDGLGLKALASHGIKLAVITARESEPVARRMSELPIDLVLQGRRDKASALAELGERFSLAPSAMAYTGDDLVDWPAMRQCHLKCAPADAHHWICAHSDHVCARPGGRGAVREVCELILAGHGRLESWFESFR